MTKENQGGVWVRFVDETEKSGTLRAEGWQGKSKFSASGNKYPLPFQGYIMKVFSAGELNNHSN